MTSLLVAKKLVTDSIGDQNQKSRWHRFQQRYDGQVASMMAI
jgi:hypothetical protein